MQSCTCCYGKKWKPTDKKEKVKDSGREFIVRIWSCWRCGHEQAEAPSITRRTAKVYYFDIERAPGVAYYYDRRTEYIRTEFLRNKPFIICWAGAWVDDEGGFQRIEAYRMTQEEITSGRNETRILETLLERLQEASHVVGHNVKGFDLKKVNGRFMELNMPLAWQFRKIDTLELQKRYCPQESNGLDYTAETMGIGGKKEIGFEDWKEIVESGCNETLDKAEAYCRHDVRIGIDWYLRLKNRLEETGVKVVR